MNKVLTEIADRLTVSTVSLFLWVSVVVGFFTGITDVIQYFRYSKGFPESSFTTNLLAAIASLLMFILASVTIIRLRRKSGGKLMSLVAASSAMAFLLAFLPRPPIGSAVRPDLFIYLGGLGTLASLLVYLSASPPDAPDNTP
ncbi:MAG: hypothetical protein KAR40_14275 [Candidatus Sabulitectum sp.]|nr:hypothetical protein [Candidatus Sabulitectum sp.]